MATGEFPLGSSGTVGATAMEAAAGGRAEGVIAVDPRAVVSRSSLRQGHATMRAPRRPGLNHEAEPAKRNGCCTRVMSE